MGVVILHVSDIHCRAGLLKDLASKLSFDVLAATGDFECLDVVEEFLSLDAQLVAVTGNLDHAAIFRRLLEAGVLVDGRVKTLKGLVFGGIGGLDPYSSSRSLAEKAGEPGSLDVLMSHHPPKGVLDLTRLGVRAGLDLIKNVVNAIKPRVHLFGHIHESPGYEVRGGTLHVNPGPLMEGRYAVVTVEGSSVSARLGRVE